MIKGKNQACCLLLLYKLYPADFFFISPDFISGKKILFHFVKLNRKLFPCGALFYMKLSFSFRQRNHDIRILIGSRFKIFPADCFFRIRFVVSFRHEFTLIHPVQNRHNSYGQRKKQPCCQN